MINPEVYLYKKSERGFELYLGSFSTLDGLLWLDPQAEAQIVNFGASGYKEFGWATENEIPKLYTIAEITEFLKDEGEIGLIDFKVTIQNIGSLNTHDDAECHFILSEKNRIFDILKTAAPLDYSNLIFNKILENSDSYITFDEFGKMSKYESFDHYLGVKEI